MKIPARTVQLGFPLELVTELGDDVRLTTFEPGEFVLLADARAEQMDAGKAGLYLVRLDARDDSDPGVRASQAETYEMWHKREPDETFELDTPDKCTVRHGVALSVDYASDKWRERDAHEEYTHDFLESGEPPEVWADTRDLASARAIVIRGGDMRVTPAGID